MKKQRFMYRISGYRWAPESFRAAKWLAVSPHAPETPVALTPAERTAVGLCFVTRGYWAAVGVLKHIERERGRNTRRYRTYGFRTKEDPDRFLYCPQICCRTDAGLCERSVTYQTVKAQLARTGGQVEISAGCELDGAYRPVNVRTQTLTADLSRPLTVWLEAA